MQDRVAQHRKKKNMRTVFYILALTFCGNSFCYSQTAEDSARISKECSCPEDEFADLIFITYENTPEFPGGDQARMKFLQENIKYPASTRHLPDGTVFVTFCVEKDGSITGIKIVRGVHESLDNEVIRVVQAMPNWKPATQRGEPICMPFTMPIRFTTQKQEPLDDQQERTPRRRNRNRN
jgi:TonB family protein